MGEGFRFLIDIVSTLPPEAFGSDGSSGDTSALRGVRISKILRVFKISRLARIVQMMRLNFDIKVSHFSWKIGAWASCCLLFLHWVACLTCFVWTVSESRYREVDLAIGRDAEVKVGGTQECLEGHHLRFSDHWNRQGP